MKISSCKKHWFESFRLLSTIGFKSQTWREVENKNCIEINEEK